MSGAGATRDTGALEADRDAHGEDGSREHETETEVEFPERGPALGVVGERISCESAVAVSRFAEVGTLGAVQPRPVLLGRALRLGADLRRGRGDPPVG